jgi:phosphoserine phosphatase
MRGLSTRNMPISAIIFDLGNTLIKQQVDEHFTLDQFNLELASNASSTLEQLHNNYKIGLLTNTRLSNKNHVRKAIIKLGLSQFIDYIVTSTDIGVEKPSPIIFEYILKSLDVRPSEAIMVGNDLLADIFGGMRMGITSIFYSCEPNDWKKLELDGLKPDYIIKDLSELIPLLNLAINQEGK